MLPEVVVQRVYFNQVNLMYERTPPHPSEHILIHELYNYIENILRNDISLMRFKIFKSRRTTSEDVYQINAEFTTNDNRRLSVCLEFDMHFISNVNNREEIYETYARNIWNNKTKCLLRHKVNWTNEIKLY
jgi:hypothetical protein